MKIETEEQLKDLIKNKIEESTILEFKDPASLKDNTEIAKDVSAMANSDGGAIIYGLAEEDGLPSEIIWSSDSILKEKIDQVIQSAIIPKVDYTLKKIDSITESGKFALVIEIKKSDIPPHMAYRKDGVKKFYIRNGSRIREMEYYEVEGLFFRRKNPILRIELRDVSKGKDSPAFEIFLKNEGKLVADQTYIRLDIPSEFQISGFDKTKDYLMGYSTHEKVLRDQLIYPELNTLVGIIYHPKKFEFGELKINFLIACKEMNFLSGEIYVDCEGKMVVNYDKEKDIPKTRPYCLNMMNHIFEPKTFNPIKP